MSSHIQHWPLVVGTTGGDGDAGVADPVGAILVVDDLASNARQLERLLTPVGHTVRLAHDGQQALDMVARDQPDLVVDVLMPTLDGFETCRRLIGDPVTCLVPVEAERGWRDRQIVRSLIGLGRNSRLVVPDVVLTPAASGEEQA
jgi:CheY-like chemotaxis protein